ncbi:hypothetical protein T484DRAFT_1915864, partial [Baffinella frigidus]
GSHDRHARRELPHGQPAEPPLSRIRPRAQVRPQDALRTTHRAVPAVPLVGKLRQRPRTFATPRHRRLSPKIHQSPSAFAARRHRRTSPHHARSPPRRDLTRSKKL